MPIIKRRVGKKWADRLHDSLIALSDSLRAVHKFTNELYEEVVNEKASSLSLFDEFEGLAKKLKKATARLAAHSSFIRKVASDLKSKKNLDVVIVRKTSQELVAASKDIDSTLSAMVKFMNKNRMLITDLTPEEAVTIVEHMQKINGEFGKACVSHNAVVDVLNSVN